MLSLYEHSQGEVLERKADSEHNTMHPEFRCARAFVGRASWATRVVALLSAFMFFRAMIDLTPSLCTQALLHCKH